MNHPLVSATRQLASKDAALRLCGPVDVNLKEAETAFGVACSLDGLTLRVDGPRAQEALDHLASLETAALKQGASITPLRAARGSAIPRTPNQEALRTALLTDVLVLAAGPAGTGKTRLPIDVAVERLKSGRVERIILTRPALEAGERIGFLPGDMKEKLDPFMRPLYDALEYHYDQKILQMMLAERIIEIAPIAFMRGRTLQRAAIVVDEAQNLTIAQTKMMLTRIGEGSTMAMVGDPEQIDLPGHTPSGFVDALKRLAHTSGISIVEMTEDDCVRSAIVGKILRAYKNG